MSLVLFFRMLCLLLNFSFNQFLFYVVILIVNESILILISILLDVTVSFLRNTGMCSTSTNQSVCVALCPCKGLLHQRLCHTSAADAR